MGMDSPIHHPLRPAAIIFDMDGVLVDSNPFHLRKWMALFQAHGVPYIEEELPKTIMGPANDWIFRHFLGEHLTREQLAELGDELEVNFRRAIGPHARSFPGVRPFIEGCDLDRHVLRPGFRPQELGGERGNARRVPSP